MSTKNSRILVNLFSFDEVLVLVLVDEKILVCVQNFAIVRRGFKGGDRPLGDRQNKQTLKYIVDA